MVDYVFYRNEYSGSAIGVKDWPVYEAKASAQLDRYKRIYTVEAPEGSRSAVEMAICSIAEVLHGFDLIANGEGGAVQSASVGSVSVSYGGTSVDNSPKYQAKELFKAASLYLDIYRGVS